MCAHENEPVHQLWSHRSTVRVQVKCRLYLPRTGGGREEAVTLDVNDLIAALRYKCKNTRVQILLIFFFF